MLFLSTLLGALASLAPISAPSAFFEPEEQIVLYENPDDLEILEMQEIVFDEETDNDSEPDANNED